MMPAEEQILRLMTESGMDRMQAINHLRAQKVLQVPPAPGR